MHTQSTARRLTTDSGRVVVTELETVDEVVDMWRDRYDRIFAAEAKARRAWGTKKPEETEAAIERRQAEWDAYVVKKLADLTTARQR